MIIYDIFTDASIDRDTKVACAGLQIVNRESGEPVINDYTIDINSTNNRAEIMSIRNAIYYITKYVLCANRNKDPFEVNIISDSLISIKGLRNWLPRWGCTSKGTLINASGAEVANQIFFKEIFSMILFYNLRVKFYHQKGHVSDKVHSLYKSEKVFYQTNDISIEKAGFTPNYLAYWNNVVDKTSRSIIYHHTPNQKVYNRMRIFEFLYNHNSSNIKTYQQLILGGTNFIK